MEITEDDKHIYIHVPRRIQGPATSSILTGQGWKYSWKLRAWRRAKNKAGRSSLEIVTNMLEKQ